MKANGALACGRGDGAEPAELFRVRPATFKVFLLAALRVQIRAAAQSSTWLRRWLAGAGKARHSAGPSRCPFRILKQMDGGEQPRRGRRGSKRSIEQENKRKEGKERAEEDLIRSSRRSPRCCPVARQPRISRSGRG